MAAVGLLSGWALGAPGSTQNALEPGGSGRSLSERSHPREEVSQTQHKRSTGKSLFDALRGNAEVGSERNDGLETVETKDLGSRPADMNSPFERALEDLLAYDPDLSAEVYRRQGTLFNNLGILKCGGRESQRTDAGAFVLDVLLQVRLDCSSGECVLGDMSFASEGDRSRIGSEEFESCFTSALAGTRFPCRECRTGSVTVKWPLRQGFGDLDLEDLGYPP